MWLISADAHGGGMRDESLRVSAWEAITCPILGYISVHGASIIIKKLMLNWSVERDDLFY